MQVFVILPSLRKTPNHNTCTCICNVHWLPIILHAHSFSLFTFPYKNNVKGKKHVWTNLGNMCCLHYGILHFGYSCRLYHISLSLRFFYIHHLQSHCAIKMNSLQYGITAFRTYLLDWLPAFRAGGFYLEFCTTIPAGFIWHFFHLLMCVFCLYACRKCQTWKNNDLTCFELD